ncbi:hypothetical protein ABZV33_35485, partial [Streptomyces microflavus]
HRPRPRPADCLNATEPNRQASTPQTQSCSSSLTARGEVEVEVTALRHYIAYRRLMNVASVLLRPRHEAILVYLRLDRARS